MSSAICFNLDQSEILSSGDGLNPPLYIAYMSLLYYLFCLLQVQQPALAVKVTVGVYMVECVSSRVLYQPKIVI